MINVGTYRNGDKTYTALVEYDKSRAEVVLVENSMVCSAYKREGNKEYAFNNKEAKNLWSYIKSGMGVCKAKSALPFPFKLGTGILYNGVVSKVQYKVRKYDGMLIGFETSDKRDGTDIEIYLEYTDDKKAGIPKEIPYVELTRAVKKSANKLEGEFESLLGTDDEFDDVPVRSLEEIMLEKDISWLKYKQYFIVNSDEDAERIFSAIDHWIGPVSYDVETTGLKINMFSKINSKEAKDLAEYNKDKPKTEKIRADSLVGVIFSVQPNVSYYFPCANRKFANLYENKDSAVRKRLVANFKSKYTIGDGRELNTDMARYWRDTPEDKVTSDCIVMERIRNILTTRHIAAHNGSFEWKASYCYDIILNLKDDTMLLHQILYKFRSTTSNKGEPSDLKSLAKKELGIEQLDLHDFFVGYAEDDTGEVRNIKGKSKKKKNSVYIDFSYMDYKGAWAYGPADGDVCLQLLYKYKKDLLENNRDREYIYNIEVIVACAIGYTEFYGLRIDEEKITGVRYQYEVEKTEIEYKIRQIVGRVSDAENNAMKELYDYIKDNGYTEKVLQFIKNYTDIIMADEEYVNLGSPQQVAKLLYKKLEYPYDGDMSVGKKVLKSLTVMKNEDGSPKYPVANLYTEWKIKSTMLTKFFDKLPVFMYPGGFMFPSFGQVATATGRMSCKNPNSQQFPKNITKIIVPRDNYVMFDSDYSQIEYRTMVALAKEEGLMELFNDPDNDYHTLMASLMYDVPYASVTPKMRKDAKSYNFGIPYGMMFKSLAILLTGMSGPEQVAEAKEKYELYFKRQPKVRYFFNMVKEMASVYKYTSTYWNRRRYYSFTDKDGNVSERIKASALRQAGNAVIQGTAADIFKIGVARTYMWIKTNNLWKQVIINNLVHDEILTEMNCDVIDTQVGLSKMVDNMKFDVKGFPPLFVGAGFGHNWAEAKGKDAEIHPHLAENLQNEVKGKSIWADKGTSREEVLAYYDNRVHQFSFDKVKDYVLNEENWGKEIHPVIGSILNLRFVDGIEGDFSGNELTTEALRKFIEDNNLGVDIAKFTNSVEAVEEEEEEVEYDDYADMGLEGSSYDIQESVFAMIDENDELFGVSLQDLIHEFGLIVSTERRVCGIDMKLITYKKREELITFIDSKQCDKSDDGAMQVVFLGDSNVLHKTDIWVKDLDGSALSAQLRIHSLLYT